MDFIGRQWTYIKAQLDGMAATTRLLIGSLVVILLLVGFLAMLYAGQSSLESVSAFIDGPPGPAVARLEARGINVTMDGGQIKVPANEVERSLAVLTEERMLTRDLFSVFDSMQGNRWMSSAQSSQKNLEAMMRLLSGVISEFDDVAHATVILDVPESTGFGDSFRKPTASVMVDARNGSLSKNLVQAIAEFVSGSVEDLEPSDVSIADRTGRSYAVSADADMFPTDVLELVAAVENQRKAKLLEALGYIDGVRIAVNVALDPTRNEHVEAIQYSESQPLVSQHDIETESRNSENSGNAGVRPNTEMSINGGGNETNTQTMVDSKVEFGDMLPTSKTVKQLAGHMAEQVNVTINVPRSYFVGLYQMGNPDVEEAPDDAALQPLVDRELAEIKEQAEPLVMTRVSGLDVPGNVVTKMIYDNNLLTSAESSGGAAGTVTALINAPWIGTASAGALALGAVALMLMLVRKATQDEPLPTVEELAGVPDVLPADEDLIGEAQDVESTMEGLEVSEDELMSRKIAEQISDLIKANPGEAGSLLGKWVDYDE